MIVFIYRGYPFILSPVHIIYRRFTKGTMADSSADARNVRTNEEVIIDGYLVGLRAFAEEGRLKHIENLSKDLERLQGKMPGIEQVHEALTKVRREDSDQWVKNAAYMLQVKISRIRPDLRPPLIYEEEHTAT